MNIKQWYDGLRNVEKVIHSISNVEIWANGATGLLNTTTLSAMTNAVKGLSKEQALLVLSTKGLTEAQKQQVLVSAGIVATENKITASTITQALAKSKLSATEKESLLTKLGLIDATTGEAIANATCTKEALLKALATKGIVGADAEAIVSSIGLTSANTAQSVSFDVLTASIWANIKAIGAWLVSNPVGWAIIGVGAVLGLSKAYDALTDSAEEVKERTDELLSAYKSALDEANSNAQTVEGLADRYEKLSKGVNGLGENVSLTTDEFSEYHNICNQIADMFPTLISGYDDEGNAILSLKGNVELLRDAYKEAQQEAYNLLVIDGKDSDGNDILKDAQNTITGSTFGAHDWGNVEKLNYLDRLMKASDSVDGMLKLWDESLDSAYLEWFEDFAGVGGTVNIKKLTPEQLADIKKQAKVLKQQFQAEIDTAVANTETLANAYLMTNEDYSKLDEQSKNIASIIVNSLNSDIVSGFGEEKENVGKYVDDIVQMLKSNPESSDALIGLFTLDSSDLSPTEAKDIVDQYIATIASYLGEDALELKIRLGFDTTDDLATKYQNALNSAKEKFGEDQTKFFEDNSINTQEEIDNWIKIADACDTAAEAQQKYLNPDDGNESGIYSLEQLKKDAESTESAYETAFSRIQRKIINFGKTVARTFEAWSNRNSAIYNEINAINKEIELQKKAYDEYMTIADSVDLSEKYKTAIQLGDALILSSATEEDREKIELYQKFYELALKAADAVRDLNDEITNLNTKRFDNVEKEFDSKLSLIQNQADMLETQIDQVEAQGMIISGNFYAGLIKNEEQTLAQLQKKKTALTNELSYAMKSGVTEGSEDWYNMQNSIADVEKAIQESNLALIEFSNTMRELDWELFDFIQQRFSHITNESDFLIDLLSGKQLQDANGNLTDDGLATIGLHGVNYNVLMAQADKYAEEIAEINKKLAEQPHNTDLIERKYELIEAQQESILAANGEREAMQDLVEEGINAQLDSLQELIDKRKEALRAEKNLFDYEKSIQNHTQDIATIQKQISAYSGDFSQESQSRIQKLQLDLQNAQENLQETEYEKYISDQEQLLDELYSEYEAILNTRLDNVDALISDVITQVNDSSSEISKTISEVTSSVGYNMTSEMENILGINADGTNAIISQYGDDFAGRMTTVNDTLVSIHNATMQMISDMSAQSQTQVNAINSVIGEIQNVKPDAKAVIEIDKPTGILFDNGGNTNSSTHKNNLSKLHSTHYFSRYAKGGRNLSKQIAWTQEDGTEIILSPARNAVLTPLSKGDDVLTAKMTDNIWDWAKINPNMFKVDVPDYSKMLVNKGCGDVTYQFGDINIPIDNVANYEDFMNKMAKDNTFAKLIHAMTFDSVTGRSKMAKNNIRW